MEVECNTNAAVSVPSCKPNASSPLNSLPPETLARFSPELIRAFDKPVYAIAPMVEQSELAFRLLCRRYGATLGWTPMFHSVQFLSKSYRARHFTTCAEDKPLVVQFCGNKPEDVLNASRFVENECDAVELNLGCPQRIAKKGNYGAFLMDDADTVFDIVSTLHKNIKLPVFCKIRIWEDYDRTLKFCQGLVKAGCAVLSVHGRTKEMKAQLTGMADLGVIAKLKAALPIPVISNGNTLTFEHVQQNLVTTGADGIMSADGLLENPALFSGLVKDPFQMCYEYFELVEKYPTPYIMVKSHICKILKQYIEVDTGFRELFFAKSALTDTLLSTVKEFDVYVKSGKLGTLQTYGEIRKTQIEKGNDENDETVAAVSTLFN